MLIGVFLFFIGFSIGVIQVARYETNGIFFKKHGKSNICNDCKKDNYANYQPCYIAYPNMKGRVCDLCDVKCCDLPTPGDRCCCLHRRDDCFTVCVARRLKKNLEVPKEYVIKYKNWKNRSH
tara:strand:+ start:88 stop:453 length:366 start_codon:yes stop_codon:yes gene_type:complete